MLLYGSTDDLRKKRLGNEARFGMLSGRRGQRATVATNEVFAFALAKAGRASEILQDSEGCFDPLLFSFASDLSPLAVGYLPADLAHGGAQFSCA